MAKLLWIEDHQVVDGFSGFRFSGMFIVILSTQIPQSSYEYRMYGMAKLSPLPPLSDTRLPPELFGRPLRVGG